MTHDDLRSLTIAETAELIRTGTLSPVELIRRHLERIEALEPTLHAFITLTSDSALAEAERAEREIRGGRYRGPLHGIPIAHKDIVWTKGIRTTAHSKSLADWIPQENATVFERLRAAGAISLGKTSLHEFAYGSPGPDEGFPAARNPWNTDHTPGSSSSGSGAAVAAALCMGATGTDTGGSIRHPASVCGIVGMKPTYGTVSTYGVIPLAPTQDHVGPMTRTVRDNAIMLQAMAGYDAKDPYSVEREIPDFQQDVGRGVRGLTIGIPRRFIASFEHEPEVLTAFAEAESALRGLGAEVREIDPPGLHEAHDASGLIISWEAYQYHRANLESRPDEFGAPFKERVLKARDYTEADHRAALALAEDLKVAYAAIFASGIDAIVSPGRETIADAFEQLLANPTFRGKSNRMYNLTGMPALTIPMGFGARGLPLGIQVAAPRDAEVLVYRVAAALETTLAVVTTSSASRMVTIPTH